MRQLSFCQKTGKDNVREVWGKRVTVLQITVFFRAIIFVNFGVLLYIIYILYIIVIIIYNFSSYFGLCT